MSIGPLQTVVIGIAVVFLTLTILTIATYIMSHVIEKYFVEEEKEEQKEKIAAIVAAVQTQNGGGD